MKTLSTTILLLLLLSAWNEIKCQIPIPGDFEIIDQGRITLYRGREMVNYNEEDESAIGIILLDSDRSKGERYSDAAIELFDGPISTLYVEKDGHLEQVGTGKKFKRQCQDWFKEDLELLEYIESQELKSGNIALLVKMYNGNAARPFGSGPEFWLEQPIYEENGLLDPVDEQEYDIIHIGRQTWMTQNLNRVCFNCGDEGQCVKCEIYGRYYSWQTAMESCPTRWRLPSESDWKVLFVSYGMTAKETEKIFGMDKRGGVGKKLLVQPGDKGFGALKAGYEKNGQIKEENESAYFWTSTQYDSEKMNQANAVEITKGSKDRVSFLQYKKKKRFSVRCMRDQQ